MVAGDEQLEARREGERVAAEKARGDRVAAGQQLEAPRRPQMRPSSVSAAVTRRAPASMAISAEWGFSGTTPGAVGQQVGRGDGGVGPEDVADGVDEDALAVAALAQAEQQHVLTGLAGERVAAEALEEGGAFRVALHGLVEEAPPQRAGRPCRPGRRRWRG